MNIKNNNIFIVFLGLGILWVLLLACGEERVTGIVGTENVITGAMVEGTILDDEGRPIQGANVILKRTHSVACPQSRKNNEPLCPDVFTPEWSLNILTDERGHFQFPIQNDSAYFLKAYFQKPEGLKVYWQDSIYLQREHTSLDLGNLSLRFAAQLSGLAESSLTHGQNLKLGISGTDIIMSVNSDGTFTNDSIYPGKYEMVPSPVLTDEGIVTGSLNGLYPFSITEGEDLCSIIDENGIVNQTSPTDSTSCHVFFRTHR